MSIRLTRPRWLVHQSRNRSHFYVASSHYQQYRLLFVRVNLAMTDSTVQQSHSENLRRIEAAKDKFEKRIRSLESRIEERSHNLDGRLNLLDRRLLSISTRIDNRVDPCVQRSSERVNIVESQTFKKNITRRVNALFKMKSSGSGLLDAATGDSESSRRILLILGLLSDVKSGRAGSRPLPSTRGF